MKFYSGKNKIDVTIPGKNLFFDLNIKNSAKLSNIEKEVKDVLKHPIGIPPIGELVKDKRNVVILADDYTRLTPTDIIIPVVLNELNKSGISDSMITIIIATGSHKLMNESQIKNKFGEEVISRVKIHQHEYLDENNLINYGKTKRGTNIWINKEVVEADFRIGI